MYKIESFSIAWDGSSVWDLPIDSMAQAPTIEQMQQFEKAKNAKVIKNLCLRMFCSVSSNL